MRLLNDSNMKPSGYGGTYAHVHIATLNIWFKSADVC
jgi:hypothetical protein